MRWTELPEGPFLGSVAGLFAGVTLYSFFPLGWSFPVWCALLALVLLFISPRDLSVFLFFITLALGSARMGLAEESLPPPSQLADVLGRQQVIEGRVVSDPERKGEMLRAIVEVKTVGGHRYEKVKALGVFDSAERISYGDILTLRGTLIRPENFETDSGRIFDYENYLRKDGITALVLHSRITEIESQSTLRGALFSLKRLFERQLERAFPEPDGGLLRGMLLGERDALSPELKDSFIRAGLIHIVVLSGYNVSLVAETLMRLFSFLPRIGNLVVGSLSVILFVLMVGAPATAIRAGIMALLIVLARALNRPRALLRGLFIAGVGMVLWNPFILAFDPSFQLSFLATLGLLVLGPPIESRLSFLTEKLGLRAIAAATISTQILVLPALLYMSGILSFVSLPANLLALIAVPLAMLLGFIGSLLAPVEFLALIPGMLGTLILSYIIAVAETAASIPWSSLLIPRMPVWSVLLSCLVIASYVVYMKRKVSFRSI